MGWFEDEPPLSQAWRAALRRLTRRAKASLPLWAGIAVLASAVATYRTARAPSRYAATLVLRVTEGQVPIPGAALGAGRLRTYVNDLALSNTHLLELIGRYGGRLGDTRDREDAIDDFRKELDVVISENDFNEEREADDPPRSTRLEITFHAGDPALAYGVAQDLAELVISSAAGHQRESLERAREAAAVGAKRAEAAVAEMVRTDPLGAEPYAVAMRRRAIDARENLEATTMALRAFEQKQALRFDVVDPGREPPRAETAGRIVAMLVFSLLGSLFGAALLAGTFDPRVVDAEDLDGLGSVVLGRVPALPAPVGSAQREV